MAWTRKHKFNAQRSAKFDSKLERSYFDLLNLYLTSGEIAGFSHHPAAVEICPAVPSIKWRIDFKVILPDDAIVYVETKGVQDQVWRIKWKLYQEFIETPCFVIGRKKQMWHIIAEHNPDLVKWRPI